MNVIETSGLTKHFGRQVAVDGIDVTVAQGQVFGFLGPNGSGKTTTIGMLVGIIRPTAGTFRLLGGETPRELLHARQSVGATLETPNFYPYLSGRDNLRIVANVKGVGPERIAECLDMVGLASRKRDKFRHYSLGMKQRLSIAATMLGDPEVVILDEPANGLDPQGMREIREIIGLLATQGKTIFLSSHLLNEVERTCSHVAIIKDGRIVRQGSVEEILRGKVVAGVRGGDLQTLKASLEKFAGVDSVSIRDDMVVVELEDDDLGAINRHLVSEGIYVSHLALRHHTLEDVFMELTGDPASRMTEIVS